MNIKTQEQMFTREVVQVNDPKAGAGHVDGHWAQRLIDGRDTASTDALVVIAEDWMPRGAISVHPHRGIETMTFVIKGSVEQCFNAGRGGSFR